MQVRQETKSDYALIHIFVETAFSTAPISDGKEQDYITALRQSLAYTPELALIAEKKQHNCWLFHVR